MMKLRIIKAAVAVPAMIAAAIFLVVIAGARTVAPDDSAALYKAKCFACHGANAEKKFDATKAEDELIQIVLKGKKAEKPPNMPGYEEKGINAEQARALVAYMKSLKQ